MLYTNVRTYEQLLGQLLLADCTVLARWSYPSSYRLYVLAHPCFVTHQALSLNQDVHLVSRIRDQVHTSLISRLTLYHSTSNTIASNKSHYNHAAKELKSLGKRKHYYEGELQKNPSAETEAELARVIAQLRRAKAIKRALWASLHDPQHSLPQAGVHEPSIDIDVPSPDVEVPFAGISSSRH